MICRMSDLEFEQLRERCDRLDLLESQHADRTTRLVTLLVMASGLLLVVSAGFVAWWAFG